MEVACISFGEALEIAHHWCVVAPCPAALIGAVSGCGDTAILSAAVGVNVDHFDVLSGGSCRSLLAIIIIRLDEDDLHVVVFSIVTWPNSVLGRRIFLAPLGSDAHRLNGGHG